MATPPDVAETWIVAQLDADAQLAAYRIAIPHPAPDMSPPYIVIRLLSSRHLGFVGGHRSFAELVYLVMGVAEADTYGGTLSTIASRIDADLHDKAGSALGGNVVSCLSIADHRLAEPATESGIQLLQAGARFRLQAQAP